jgi:hypothetical protein
MSTGAACRFYWARAGAAPPQMFYQLQGYPYGETSRYDEYGPFATFAAAYDHLHAHHANPGGFVLTPLPGCSHDVREALDEPGHTPTGYVESCRRCGARRHQTLGWPPVADWALPLPPVQAIAPDSPR